ncbi:MAG: hypothetical protein V4739_09290 [Pseudomonadota bacterium]
MNTSNEKAATSYELYLRDLGYQVRELAIESKQVAAKTNSDFSIGYMAGFHRIVSLMQQQAKVFDIPLADIALDGIDPDSELV